METNYTYTLTPEDIYKFDWRKSIEGYDVVAFTVPHKDENEEMFFLSAPGDIRGMNDGVFPIYHPRIILRKRKPKRFIFEECPKHEAEDGKGLYLISNDSEAFLVFKTAFPEPYTNGDYVFVKRIKEKE